MRTIHECKKILFNLGIELGVSPRLISERLLSVHDKNDMLSGVLTIEALRHAIEAAKERGLFHTYPPLKDGIKRGYRNPENYPLESFQKKDCHYRAPFVCPDWRVDCRCRTKTTYHE